jgi:hypothetical protein
VPAFLHFCIASWASCRCSFWHHSYNRCPTEELSRCIKNAVNSWVPGLAFLLEVFSRSNIADLYADGKLAEILTKLYSSELAEAICRIIDEKISKECIGERRRPHQGEAQEELKKSHRKVLFQHLNFSKNL